MRLSIIIPAHNEEELIYETLEQIGSSLDDFAYEIIVVNDHSRDKTVDRVKEAIGKNNKIRIVENLREKGFANALVSGIMVVRSEVVLPVMADLCDDIATIKEMARKLESGYDIVCGSRYIKGGGRLGGPKLKAFFSWFVSKSLNFLIKIPINDLPNSFKMYRKEILENMEIQSKGFEVSMEISLKAFFLGYKLGEVPTIWKERNKGKSNFRIIHSGIPYFRWYIWAIFKKWTRKF